MTSHRICLLLALLVLAASVGCASPTPVPTLLLPPTWTPPPTATLPPTVTQLPTATVTPSATPVPSRTSTQTPVPPPTATRPPLRTPTPTRLPVSLTRRTLILPGSDPPSLDPGLSSDGTSHAYVVEIYSGLVKLDLNLRVSPDIASSWDLSDDGKTYTFHLRKNVRFHNGRRATAQDFKYSIERAADPALKSSTAATYLGDIVGVKEKLAGTATSVRGVRVIDDYTVEIEIAEPRSYFLAKLTYPTAYLVDRANVEQGGQTWTGNPNGTGPFKLLEYTRGKRIVLVANENFYDTPPFVSRVEFVLRGFSQDMYESGYLDVIGVGSSSIDRVSDPSNPLNKQLRVSPQLSTQFLVFNTRQPPFDDPKVRQAFTLAVDREQIIKVAYRGLPQVANSILPPGMPGYSEPPRPVYDPALARQLLAQSKYAGNMPDIAWHVSGTGGTVSDSVQAMVKMWKDNLGVNVSVQQTEWAGFLTLAHDPQRGGMQMYSMGWSADYVDPENFVDILFRTGGNNNYSLYSNPAVDRLLDQAAREKDLETRLKLYQQAERMILADYPVMPLTHSQSYTLTKPYVKDLANPATAMSHLRYVWLSD